MPDASTVNFSDLLQRPNETVDKLKSARSRSLRVRRRGTEDDLVLTTAARADQDDELVEVAARMLRAVMGNPVLRSKYLLDILPQVFPWMRFLEPEDQVSFAQELIDVMDAGHDIDSPTPVLHLISQWRHTAEVYADPDLLKALRPGIIDDAGAVAQPAE
ncbi:hypothetical protein FB561_2703 [Kribbella amoyensis]|uniref:Prevent-host-death family protein n=1 Tax=Kribbella amoyensis TaxID=996641 RepID=A0A561BRQ9_9ACTN|nr:hypothetical protein [Kribbella amoyensis]TWD81587.1 hypothetical protein FB561_2703 [Kribbella amoyensis]